MIDVTRLSDWPKHLEPVGLGDGNQPPFEEWWGVAASELGHLGREVAEQWPYRHWNHSPYSDIPFNELDVCRVVWAAEQVLERLFVSDRKFVLADYDYGVFYESKNPGEDALEPGRRMLETGTWRTPVLALETPNGFIHREGSFPDQRYLLIEGHCRHRCLNSSVIVLSRNIFSVKIA